MKTPEDHIDEIMDAMDVLECNESDPNAARAIIRARDAEVRQQVLEDVRGAALDCYERFRTDYARHALKTLLANLGIDLEDKP